MRKTTLPGGLRVITETLPGVRSASVGLWVGVGSRDEKPNVAGAAHFLEHLLFKATPTRDAFTIAEEMDSRGAELNAFTSKEYTCFYAHVLDEHVDLAIDIVSDVVLRGSCKSADVEIERDVVLEEIAMRDDDHEDLLADSFVTAMFGNHVIGRPVIGTTESIEAMTRNQLHSFHTRRYTPDKMVLSVAGNIDHAHIVSLARKYFKGHLDSLVAPAGIRSRSSKIVGKPELSLIYRDTEQAHINLGVRTNGRNVEDRWALSVLNTALGGGLSSRLFQEVRESRGLAYSVYSSIDTFSEAGTFSVYSGCSPERLPAVVAVITDVLADVAAHGLTDVEVTRAKGSLRGGMVLGLEDSQSRMNRNGSAELNYAKHSTLAQVIKRIDAVTTERVNAVAKETLLADFGAAVVGPFKQQRLLPKELRSLVNR